MNYEEFRSKLLCELKGYFPEDVTFQEQKVFKNNGVVLDAVTIHEKGSFVSPNIYINGLYDQFISAEDVSIKSLAGKIYDTYMDSSRYSDISIDDFLDFEKARSNIVFKLINYEKNKDRLKDMPYVRYLDLAVVFYYLFKDEGNEMASVLINNTHMERWKTSLDEINELAMKNTPGLLQAEIRDMFDLMRSRMNLADFDEWKSDIDYVPMYIISNKKGVNGAACLMYPGLLTDLSERLGSDLYIIPSSVHELIMVPTKSTDDRERFDEMIRYVNKTQLAETEVLSDHVYFYTRKNCAVGY